MNRPTLMFLALVSACAGNTDCAIPSSPAATPAIRISAGSNHTCAVLANGAVRCWGYNRFGQLGYDRFDDVGDDETPASAGDVPIGGPVSDVSAGFYHTCAVLETGAVRCWGRGTSGELGHGNKQSIGTGIAFGGTHDPTVIEAGDVPLGGKAVQVAAGFNYTCALLDTGAVRCWGSGGEGELGYGNTSPIGDDETPASAGDIALGGKAIQIAAGDFHTCALLDTHAVRCWGASRIGLDLDGQLGYGNKNNIGDDETPASAGDVQLGAPALQVTAAENHTCAILDGGRVRCWGHGDLGNGTTEAIGDNETPAAGLDVALGGVAVQLEAGGTHTCALLDTGAVRCWGSDILGYANFEQATPDIAGDLELGGAAVRITAGRDFNCAILNTGAVRCWGRGGLADNEPSGQLGYGGNVNIGDNEVPACAGDVPIE